MKFLWLVSLTFIAFIYANISLVQSFENIIMTFLASVLIAFTIYIFIYIFINIFSWLKNSRKIKNLDNQYYINLHDWYYQNKEFIFFEWSFTKINKDYFKNIWNKYASDSKNIYFEWEILNKKIDVYSFKYLGWNYSKDNNNIYYCWDIIENVDTYSFKVLEILKDIVNHAVDKNNYIIDNEIIWSNNIENIWWGYILNNWEYSFCDYWEIETNSLKSLWDWYAIWDKNIYLWWEEIYKIWKNDSYKNLGHWLLQINNKISYYSQKTDINPEELHIYSKYHIWDDKKIYHLNDSDIDYMEIWDELDYDIVTDIEVSDIKSFKTLSNNVASDKNKVYYWAETMGDSKIIEYMWDDFFKIDWEIIPSYENHI